MIRRPVARSKQISTPRVGRPVKTIGRPAVSLKTLEAVLCLDPDQKILWTTPARGRVCAQPCFPKHGGAPWLYVASTHWTVYPEPRTTSLSSRSPPESELATSRSPARRCQDNYRQCSPRWEPAHRAGRARRIRGLSRNSRLAPPHRRYRP